MATKKYCENCRKATAIEADMSCIGGCLYLFMTIVLLCAGIIPGILFVMLVEYTTDRRCAVCKTSF